MQQRYLRPPASVCSLRKQAKSLLIETHCNFGWKSFHGNYVFQIDNQYNQKFKTKSNTPWFMKRVIALTFLSMLFFSSQSPTVMFLDGEGEYYSEDISDPPIIGFNDFNGIFVDENSTLSGFIVSSVLPDSTEWYVSDL